MLNSSRIDFTICVDGLKPLPISNAFQYASRNLNQFWRQNAFASSTTEPSSYTLEEITREITTPHGRSIDPEHAHHMMERSIAPSRTHPGKYYFTRDPRIKLGEFFTFPQDEIVKAAQKVTCPICVIKSQKGSYYEHKDDFNAVLEALKRSSRDFQYHTVEGKHHSILNNPECMVDIIDNFTQKHYTGDSITCGLDNIVLDW
nr:unnamed protein product [Callosobruchus chinensis]